MARHDMTLLCQVGPNRILSRPLEGMVENMSRGGMLLRWEGDTPVPVAGSRLIVEVALPASDDFGSRLMRCHTSVVRVVNAAGASHSVALKIEQIRFVDASKLRKINTLTAQSAAGKAN